MNQVYVSLSKTNEDTIKDYRRYIDSFLRANCRLVFSSDFDNFVDFPNDHPDMGWVLGRERMKAIVNSRLALFYIAGDTDRKHVFELAIARRNRVPIFVYSPLNFGECFSSGVFLYCSGVEGVKIIRHTSKLEAAIIKELGLTA